jgi:hypothetical protein
MPRIAIMAALGAFLALGAPAAAQLALPQVSVPAVDGIVRPATGMLGDIAAPVVASARMLAQARLERIDALVRRNREAIEFDLLGQPARRGELLLTDPTPDEIARAEARGFRLIAQEPIDGLELSVARLQIPRGISLGQAEKQLEAELPGAEIGADLLHFQAGGSSGSRGAGAAPAGPDIATPVGIIDGAPGSQTAVREARGFAKGAPLPSNHGSAVASLLLQAGARNLRVADIYGADPAGGNALALARGLGWLVAQGSKVVTISLVGPRSPLVARAVAAAQHRGVAIVAAVGNDGPAAPPSFPASYPGVIAVTAVDGRNRPLIEAGRAAHLDYAAPGADMLAVDARGRSVRVRGTSYAAPLVAARLAAAWGPRDAAVARLDREARDLGTRGADAAFGRGLVCETCRRQH